MTPLPFNLECKTKRGLVAMTFRGGRNEYKISEE